jgi:hypothetical protein
VSEEDAEEIGREEPVVCTGRIYTSDWPNSPNSYTVNLLLPFTLAPTKTRLSQPEDAVSVSCRKSAKALATQFETACPINSQHLNSYSCGNLKNSCINELFSRLTVVLLGATVGTDRVM